MIRASKILLLTLALPLLGSMHNRAWSSEETNSCESTDLEAIAQERAACGAAFRLDSKNGPLEQVSLHNQGPVPNCFAHAAATLYDAWGLSHRAPLGYFNREHRSSPYWSSIQLPGRPTNVLDSLRWLHDHGSCDQKAYSRLTTSRYEDDFNEHFQKLNGLWQEAQKKNDEVVWNLAYDFNRRVGMAIFRPSSLPDAKDVFAALKAPTVTEMIALIYQSVCRSSEVYEKLPIPAPVEKSYLTAGSDPELFINQTWNRELNNPQPIGLGFCSAAFTDPFISIPRGNIKTWDGCKNHAVTLLGRRWSDERSQCEYLVRNSWGSTCSAYDSSAVVECEDKTKEVWVSGDWINRSVFSTVHIAEWAE